MRAAILAALLAAPAAAAPRLGAHARAFRPGEIILVAVEDAEARTPPEGSFRDESLRFFPAASSGTWLAFAAIDLEASTGAAVLSARARGLGGPAIVLERVIQIAPAAFATVELKVEQKYVTPAKADAERAESEASTLKTLFIRGEEKRLFEGRFDSPIPGAPTARFGERRVFNGRPRAPHSGMDLKAPLGRAVRAPAAGRVTLAGPLYYQGKTVVIDHGLGLTTLYAHLSRVLVKPGQLVKKGQVIGRVGATGRVTGPHLHWAMKYRGARVDPYSLIFLDLDARLKTRATRLRR